jgi:hypothetical protein
MNWKELKKKLLKNPEFKEEYKALEPEYKLASTSIKLQLTKGLSRRALDSRFHGNDR